MLGPNMRIILRGAAAVLGMTVAVAGVIGLALTSPLVALNAVGFVGGCALSMTAIFYSVAIERIGFHAARTAATTLVAVLAGSAAFMAVVLVGLLVESRFRDEASRFGLHSAAGIAVLVIFMGVVAVLWRGR